MSSCRSVLVALLTVSLRAQAPTAALITIESPSDYQIFQRQTRTTGEVLISGHISVDAGSIEVRVAGNSKQLPVDRASHTFRAEIEAPAGGFYELTVRLNQAEKPVAQVTVPHVGVGELFVIAGQSNATNYGEVKQQTKSGMVVSFGGDDWRLANDPQPGVQDNSRNGSFIPAFGDALYERYHVPIGVACVGHGSTSVRQWLLKDDPIDVLPTMSKFVITDAPNTWKCDGRLFDGMLKRIRQLGPSGFRALLWHQGESDANQKPEHQISADEYRRLLERVIRESRKQAGWNFPWFVAQATYHTPDDTSYPPIREAQRAIWESGLALEGPDTDKLTGDYRQNNGKGVHFSAKGLDAHGELWAGRAAAYLDSVLK